MFRIIERIAIPKSIRFCTCAEDEEAENAHKGNQVKIDDEGDVYVNNAKIDEPYLRQKTKGDTDIEFPYTVPNGKLFVMGDNRALSLDSRNFSIGCIAEEQIVGKIIFRVWPLIKIGAVH